MSSHKSVVESFVNKQPAIGCNLTSDGKTIRSYGHLVIAKWEDNGWGSTILVILNYRSSGTYISTSTTRHVNMVIDQAHQRWLDTGKQFSLVNP